MPNKYKISFFQSVRGKLLLLLLAFISIPALLIGGIANYNARKNIEARLASELKTIADLKKSELISWINERQADTRLLADNFLNEDHFSVILDPNSTEEKKELFTNFLMDNITSVQQVQIGYTEIFIADINGNIVLSTRNDRVGEKMEDISILDEAISSSTQEYIKNIYFNDRTLDYEMVFSRIMNAVDPETMVRVGQPNGILVIRVSMNKTVYPLINNWPGIGETGETILTGTKDNNNYFLNPTRFLPEGALSFQIFNSGNPTAANLAASGKEGFSKVIDYRGQEVWAAYRFIPEVEWGFVAKQDLSEAFSPITVFTYQWLTVMLVVFLIASFVAFYIAKNVTAPLTELIDASKLIALGNFNINISEGLSGEFNTLSKAFNNMISAVVKRDTHLREHTEEVTTLLQLSNEFLGITSQKEILHKSLQHCNRVIQSEYSMIYLADEDCNSREIPSSSDRLDRFDKDILFELGCQIAVETVKQGKVIIQEDYFKDISIFKENGEHRNRDKILSISVPMMANNKAIGAFWILVNQESSWDEEKIQIIKLIANQTAVAMERTRLFDDLGESYDRTLDALAFALDARDKETIGHSRRVVLYTLALAREMGVSNAFLPTLQRGALLHDIGKIGIPDAILLKPGPLSDEEYEIMKTHAELGKNILSEISFLEGASEIVFTHQERWDGSGYPQGLKETEIPFGSRIFAVADSFDAITSDRPYRDAMTFAEAYKEITNGSGTEYDPEVVDAFLNISKDQWLNLRHLSLISTENSIPEAVFPNSNGISTR